MATTSIRGANHGTGSSQIREGTISNTDIHVSASIATTKLADGANFILRTGAVAFTNHQDMDGFKITGLGLPTNNNDAVRLTDLHSIAAGVDWKASVRLTTSASLSPSYTVSGIVLTATANGALTVDEVAVAIDNRILLKDGISGVDNGIYFVSVLGDAGTPYELTRATDADSDAEVTAGMAVFTEEGTANADTGWILTTTGAIILGTDALTFTQFTGLGTITAGAGLTKTGNTIDVIGTVDRIIVNPDYIDVGTDVVVLPGAQIITGPKTFSLPVTSSVATGTAPFVVASTTEVANLNAATAGTATHLAAGGAGTIPYQSAAGTTVQLAAGSTGQLLQSNGAAAPSWATPAGGLATSNFVTRETPVGIINGSNVEFTLYDTPISGTDQVYLNGIQQEPGADNDYTIVDNVITYLTAPLSGDKIRVTYIK